MTAVTPEWETRNDELWAAIDDHDPADFRRLIADHAAVLGDDHPVSLFERACAWDSTGHSDKAVPLYDRALALGLEGVRRRRVVIQMASSIRNLGRPAETLALLTEERMRTSDELDDAVVVMSALALADLGREREGLSMVVTAMAAHLPRYQRSTRNYARLLVEPETA
ncbi:tetratricopeptide repeat protein [Phytomonospora sp. NPDC050363]|uniref:tetratricopeptide repeat protein n=1 Tax=Phytomonospora sp. NPDC050363 TaxID=3155642 RepID=UPI0033C0637A